MESAQAVKELGNSYNQKPESCETLDSLESLLTDPSTSPTSLSTLVSVFSTPCDSLPQILSQLEYSSRLQKSQILSRVGERADCLLATLQMSEKAARALLQGEAVKEGILGRHQMVVQEGRGIGKGGDVGDVGDVEEGGVVHRLKDKYRRFERYSEKDQGLDDSDGSDFPDFLTQIKESKIIVNNLETVEELIEFDKNVEDELLRCQNSKNQISDFDTKIQNLKDYHRNMVSLNIVKCCVRYISSVAQDKKARDGSSSIYYSLKDIVNKFKSTPKSSKKDLIDSIDTFDDFFAAIILAHIQSSKPTSATSTHLESIETQLNTYLEAYTLFTELVTIKDKAPQPLEAPTLSPESILHLSSILSPLNPPLSPLSPTSPDLEDVNVLIALAVCNSGEDIGKVREEIQWTQQGDTQLKEILALSTRGKH